jgi:tetratricopeptide (TPR) repeat protein
VISRHSFRWLVLLALLIYSAPGPAQVGGDPAPAKVSPAEIAKLIEQLGARDFAGREKASQRLWQAGRAAEPALRDAVKNAGDPEVARRAGKILERFRVGIYPDTPPKIVALIERYTREEAKERDATVKELLAAGGAGYAALLKLAVLEPDRSKRDAFFLRIVPRIEADVVQLSADGRWDAAEQLLEQCATPAAPLTLEHYAAFLLLRGRLDAGIARWREYGKFAGDETLEGLALMLKANGDLDAAQTVAEKAGKPELVKTLLWARGDWKALAKRSAEPDAESKRAPLGLRALYHRLASEREAFEKRLAEALEESPPTEGNDAYFSATSTAGILFINDRPKEAFDALCKERLWVPAFERLTGQMKYDEAITLLSERDKSEPKSIEAVRRSFAQLVQRDVKLARLQVQLGEKDRAAALLRKLGDSFGEAAREDPAPYFEVIQAALELGMDEDAFALATKRLKWGEHTDWPALARLAGRAEVGPEVWLKLLHNKYPTEPPVDILKRVRRILSRETTEKDYMTVVDDLQSRLNAFAQVRRENWLTGVAEYSLQRGWDTAARKYLQQAVDTLDSADALQRLADFFADRKQWKEAAEQYGKAWDKDRTKAIPLYWRGWCLLQLGQATEGRRLMELAELVPLGNEKARYDLAQALRKRGLTEAADREFGRVVLLGTSMSVSVTNAYGRLAARASRQRDFERAAEYWQKIPVAALDRDYYYEPPKGTWLIALQVRTERTLALIATGSLDDARREIDYCMNFLPGDADLTLRLTTELDKRGERKLAEQVFTRSLDVHRESCRKYAKSAGRHNNLAWLCARCRRHLDEALEHARQAVELAPNEAGYLDTLAEVHFQRGETEIALELMKRCLELEPASSGYRRQLERFRKGDRMVEPPSVE